METGIECADEGVAAKSEVEVDVRRLSVPSRNDSRASLRAMASSHVGFRQLSYIIGIDLGTTNCAVAFVNPAHGARLAGH